MKTTILYLALGERCARQAIYSILTLLGVYEGRFFPFRVLVLTDHPSLFAGFGRPIEAKYLSPEQVEAWTRPHGFVLRVKIKVIQEAMAGNSDVLFVDCDTLFMRRPDAVLARVQAGRPVMHLYEHPLGRSRQLHPELCPRDVVMDLSCGTQVVINNSLPVWNSGVLGIPALNVAEVADVLELTDRIYEQWPAWHVEQISFSAVLSQMGLSGCAGVVFHYWTFKGVMDAELAKLPEVTPNRLLGMVRRARRRTPILVAHIRFKMAALATKKWVRDLPGVYRTFKAARWLLRRAKSG